MVIKVSSPRSSELAPAKVIDQTSRAEEEALVIEGELEEEGGYKRPDYLARWRALLLDLITHISERVTSCLQRILHYLFPAHN